MTYRAPYSPQRLAALVDVYRDRVEFDNSLGAGQGNGYRWAERIGGAMFDAQQDLLVELWQADLIEVDTSHLFAARGHRVRLTHRGWQTLRQWGFTADHDAPRAPLAAAAVAA